MQPAVKRIIHSLICILPFAVLFALTELFFKDAYLFAWMREHWYLLLFAAAAVIGFINFKAGAAFSLSYFVSLTAAQLIGDAVQKHRAARITADMSEGESSKLMENNPAFAIWLAVFAELLLFCVIFAILRRRKSGASA
ncbi:MAG: hypothetical protein IKZ82_01840 [Clostridia bacterium]|nr:hypothetical protein [Clostridia bacterium]